MWRSKRGASWGAVEARRDVSLPVSAGGQDDIQDCDL